MQCPKCGAPIDAKQVIAEHAREIAKRPRPGSRKQVKNPWGRAGKPKKS